MPLEYSFIIPVYNRPDEIKELLESFKNQETTIPFEVVIIEDGSSISSDGIVKEYNDVLDITYFTKPNSGPGDSRNYGMKRAKGNYFIILDSDCILPPFYMEEMNTSLSKQYVDCFGGPDAAHPSFSRIQKAISYVMTSFLTTGGIRGGKKQVQDFQPRSFNMGLSKEAFIASKGFGDIHPGEDPDLVLRLWSLGFKTRLLSEAFVYHKRRISWSKFYTQVHKFGLVRPILNSWHPSSRNLTYWLPTLFLCMFLGSIICVFFGIKMFIILFFIYFGVLFLHSSLLNKNGIVGIFSVFAMFIQFYGYGTGFLKSTIAVGWLKKLPRKRFPKLFFK